LGTLVYDVLVAFLRFVTRVFFRTVEVGGLEHVPEEGPVIFVGNHPNSLLDPVLITTSCGRRVSFAAKDTLFESKALLPLLKAMGAIPIKRRQDHQGGALDNTEAFRALFAVLKRGGVFGIFPEGISHARSELAPLKTGAARIALGALREGIPVVIVPCGLTYMRRTRLRSRVLVQFGEPVAVERAFVDARGDDERGAAAALTEDIDEALRALTINAPDFDTLSVLDAVRRLYSPPGKKLTLAERAEISRRFIAHYQKLKHVPEIEALYDDVEAYVVRLRARGITDRELKRRVSAKTWIARVVGHLLLVLVWLPLALPGVLLHAPILVAAVIAGEAFTARKDVKATTKFATATALTLAGYAAVVALFLWTRPTLEGLYWAPAVLLVLLLSGFATIRVLERQSALRRSLLVFTLLLNLRGTLARLAIEREALRERTLELVDKYIDPNLARVVAPEEQA